MRLTRFQTGRRACAVLILVAGALTLAAQSDQTWQSVFPVDKKNLGVKGSNPWFPLTPGYRQLVEITRDYYAIDSVTNDVYYFGEDVDVYKNGKIVSHEGAWLSGVKGAKFGLFMPGSPKVGQKFYQEIAPGIGMDRIEIVSNSERVVTPAGTFEKCIHTLETTPLEKGVTDHKWYAAGVGPVKDGDAPLVQYGKK